MNYAEPLIIFSMTQSARADVLNCAAHAEACRALQNNGISFANAHGCYKGTRERAIVAVITSEADETAVRLLALAGDQESVLYVGRDRRAQLQTPDGHPLTSLGNFRRVSRSEALRYDGWTRIQDEYYVAGEYQYG